MSKRITAAGTRGTSKSSLGLHVSDAHKGRPVRTGTVGGQPRTIDDQVKAQAGAPLVNNCSLFFNVVNEGAPVKGQLAITSMKLSSLMTQLRSGAAYTLGLSAYPEFFTRSSNYRNSDGKNVWDLAIAQTLTRREDLLYSPGDGVLANATALADIYADRAGAQPLVAAMINERAKHVLRVRQSNSAIPLPYAVSPAPDLEQMRARCINLTEVLAKCAANAKDMSSALAQFTRIIESLVHLGHSLTASYSARTAQEDYIQRKISTLSEINTYLSKFVVPDEEGGPSATSNYSSLGLTLFTIKRELETRGSKEPKYTVFDVVASTKKTGELSQIKLQLHSAARETDPTIPSNANQHEVSRRISIYHVMNWIYHSSPEYKTLISFIEQSMIAQVKEDIAHYNKKKTPDAQLPMLTDPEIKDHIYNRIYLGHMRVPVPPEPPRPYAAAKAIYFRDGQSSRTSPNNIASFLLYYFLLRFDVPLLNEAARKFHDFYLDPFVNNEANNGNHSWKFIRDYLANNITKRAESTRAKPKEIGVSTIEDLEKAEREQLENTKKKLNAGSQALRAGSPTQAAGTYAPPGFAAPQQPSFIGNFGARQQPQQQTNFSPGLAAPQQYAPAPTWRANSPSAAPQTNFAPQPSFTPQPVYGAQQPPASFAPQASFVPQQPASIAPQASFVPQQQPASFAPQASFAPPQQPTSYVPQQQPPVTQPTFNESPPPAQFQQLNPAPLRSGSPSAPGWAGTTQSYSPQFSPPGTAAVTTPAPTGGASINWEGSDV